MPSRMFGLTTFDVRKLAYDVTVQHNYRHPFNDGTKLAGVDWLNSFMKRRKLSIRTPQATSISRLIGFNKPKIDEFFEAYRNILTKHYFSAVNIFNIDETGVTTVQKPVKVLAEKGQRIIDKATSAERGQLVTVICAMSAAGTYVPSMFVFPRKIRTMMHGVPPASLGDVSDYGWTNEGIFSNG